jgi:hypothetical protein
MIGFCSGLSLSFIFQSSGQQSEEQAAHYLAVKRQQNDTGPIAFGHDPDSWPHAMKGLGTVPSIRGLQTC